MQDNDHMLASRPYTLSHYSLGNPVLVSLLLILLSYFPPTVSPLQRTFLNFPSGAFCSKIHSIVSYWSSRVLLNNFSASYSLMFYLVHFYAYVWLHYYGRCRLWCPLCRKNTYHIHMVSVASASSNLDLFLFHSHLPNPNELNIPSIQSQDQSGIYSFCNVYSCLSSNHL